MDARRLLLLGALYLAQGLPYGFFTQYLPAMMRMNGFSKEEIGRLGILALPWTLKFLWAPLVDRYGSARFGRRRSFILPLQALTVAVMIGLAVMLPEGSGMPPLAPLMAAVFLTNLLAATQDVATDGLAVGLLSEKERGLGNAIQVAGYRVGMIIGGGVLLVWMGTLGWSGTFAAMAVILAICTLPVLFHREVPGGKAELPVISLDWFYRPGLGGWLLILLLYKAGDAMASPMVKPLLVDRGYTLEDIGWLGGTLGSVMGLAGALLGGWLAGSIGRRRALLLCGGLQMVSVLGYAAAAAWGSDLRVQAAVAFEHLAGGMATVALFTAMMDRCRPDREATDYTVQASVVVLATGVAGYIGGVVADQVEYPVFFVGCAVVCLGGLGWVERRGMG